MQTSINFQSKLAKSGKSQVRNLSSKLSQIVYNSKPLYWAARRNAKLEMQQEFIWKSNDLILFSQRDQR